MASWIIPCNPKYYDVFGAFRSLDTIDWRQTAKSIDIGDTVYVYTGRPIQAITHKCYVLEVDIPYDRADLSDERFNIISNDGSLQPYRRYMRLQLVREYDCNDLSFATLIKHGLKGNIQGPQRLSPPIQELIESVD